MGGIKRGKRGADVRIRKEGEGEEGRGKSCENDTKNETKKSLKLRMWSLFESSKFEISKFIPLGCKDVEIRIRFRN